MKLEPKVLEIEKAYETVFIIRPTLSDEEYEKKVEEYVNFLQEKGAKIVHTEVWGLRKLAYPIQKHNSGYYVLIEFRSVQTLPEVLERKYRLDEDIMRFLTVYLDKYGVEFNERRRKKMQKGSSQEESNEESSENTSNEEN